jgi:hypothetical protein
VGGIKIIKRFEKKGKITLYDLHFYIKDLTKKIKSNKVLQVLIYRNMVMNSTTGVAMPSQRLVADTRDMPGMPGHTPGMFGVVAQLHLSLSNFHEAMYAAYAGKTCTFIGHACIYYLTAHVVAN